MYYDELTNIINLFETLIIFEGNINTNNYTIKIVNPNTNIIEISTAHYFPKKMVEKSVAISELKPIDNITFSGEEHLQNFYKGFSHV